MIVAGCILATSHTNLQRRRESINAYGGDLPAESRNSIPGLHPAAQRRQILAAGVNPRTRIFSRAVQWR